MVTRTAAPTQRDAEDGGAEGTVLREQVALQQDDLFHLLQNQRRRRVLQYMQDENSRVDMRDVAEQVAAWENDVEVQQLSSDERQRVYIALYQNHLPKLDDAGVLSYNQDRGIVERLPPADQLDPYLDVAADAPARSETDEESGTITVLRYYAVAATASVISTVATFLGLIATSGLALATLVTGMFTAVTIGAMIRDLATPG